MTTVLVTGCGGAVGLGAVKALRVGSQNLRLIGVDADPYAVCFYLKNKERILHKAYIVPRAEHPDYIPEISNICRGEKVDIILPCTEAELEKLSISKTEISDCGTKIIISPLETIRICRDKWLTYCHLGECLPMVRSALPDVGIQEALQSTGLPAVIKPRLGWGSRNIHKVKSAEEARIAVSHIDKPIIQTWLQGEEYTVDGLTDRYGKAVCIIPRRRIKTLSGLSLQGITVRDKKLIELGKKITKYLKIIGPFNFQAKKIDGEPKIFEINSRFAGTGILSVKAGVNIPLLAVKEMCNLKISSNIHFKEGLVVSRYLEEVFFDIDELRSPEY
jgi:carbamoyl-phosphate synthase large subunit